MFTILIIDDEKELSEMLRIALTKNGYNVETAPNGKEGLGKFNEQFFDVVITDLCMPFMDGNTVAKHIRNTERPSTSIIGISGTPWLFEANKFDTVVEKPFSIKSILGTVRELTTKTINLCPPSEVKAVQAFS